MFHNYWELSALDIYITRPFIVPDVYKLLPGNFYNYDIVRRSKMTFTFYRVWQNEVNCSLYMYSFGMNRIKRYLKKNKKKFDKSQ